MSGELPLPAGDFIHLALARLRQPYLPMKGKLSVNQTFANQRETLKDSCLILASRLAAQLDLIHANWHLRPWFAEKASPSRARECPSGFGPLTGAAEAFVWRHGAGAPGRV